MMVYAARVWWMLSLWKMRARDGVNRWIGKHTLFLLPKGTEGTEDALWAGGFLYTKTFI